jgi:hypothetical protein
VKFTLLGYLKQCKSCMASHCIYTADLQYIWDEMLFDEVSTHAPSGQC